MRDAQIHQKWADRLCAIRSSRGRFFIGGKKSLREADVGAVGERVVHFETPPTLEENPLRRKMGVQTVRNIILTCEKQP